MAFWNKKDSNPFSRIDDSSLWEQGTSCLKAGEIQSALECADELLRRDPYNGGNWHLKATALGMAGREEDAVGSFRKAVELAGDAKTLGVYLGGLIQNLYFSGQLEETLERCETYYQGMTTGTFNKDNASMLVYVMTLRKLRENDPATREKILELLDSYEAKDDNYAPLLNTVRNEVIDSVPVAESAFS